MKQEITIFVEPKIMTVLNERVKKARLYWTCADMDIYLLGELPAKRYAAAANLAMQECVSRDIPPRTLKNARIAPLGQKTTIPAKQLPLFPSEKKS